VTFVPGIPRPLIPLFLEVLGRDDPALLDSILASGDPTMEERERVMMLLAREFSANLRPDYEPTERGKQIDDLLGKFLLQFPIER
jgi:hypothetical protein